MNDDEKERVDRLKQEDVERLKLDHERLQREREAIAEEGFTEAMRLKNACAENMKELGLAGLIANLLGAPFMHLKNQCCTHFADAARAKEQERVLQQINLRLASPVFRPL